MLGSMRERSFLILLLAAVVPGAMAHADQVDQSAIPEAEHSTTGYPSVAAASQALHASPNVVFTTENGWTIATDRANYAIWSFAPSTSPAYPAVVKRQVVREGTQTSIHMSVQCEASKAACDDLVRTFTQMTTDATSGLHP